MCLRHHTPTPHTFNHCTLALTPLRPLVPVPLSAEPKNQKDQSKTLNK
jgi:hypothetical protein